MASIHAREKEQALEHLTNTLRRVHGNFYRDAKNEGRSHDEAYKFACAATARELADQIMTMLASCGDVSIFEEVMRLATASTVERSHGGAVCPCCEKPWGHGAKGKN